jgi:flagellar FliL protein
MSAAAAAAPADAAPKKGKKKLVIMLVAALLVLGGGGGAAVFVMKKKAAEAAAAAEAEAGDDADAPARKHSAAKQADPKAPPVFLPLEPFVVNLADREVDRFAQVGITLEIEDAKAADQLKLYMPAIRNGILMILAHKTSAELQERAGKEKLAREIARAAVLPMGIEVPSEEEIAAEEEEAAKAAAASGKKKKRRKVEVDTPVKAVNFSSFIIQ